MNNLKSYINYFKYLFSNHPKTSEGGVEKVFEVISIDEAIGDLRSNTQEKGYIVRLITPSYKLTGNSTSATTASITGGLIVAHYHSNRKGGKEEYVKAMDNSLRLLHDTLERMILDSRNNHPLFSRSMNRANDINILPKENTGDVGYSGFLMFFSISEIFNVCLNRPDIPLWRDGGKTPHSIR